MKTLLLLFLNRKRLCECKKCAGVILFTLGTISSEEATITGRIINSSDDQPIHGANIYINELALGVSSQVNGNFTIDKLSNGKVALTVSMIGFQDMSRTLRLNAGINNIGNVYMITDTIKIKGINVDAHRNLQPKNFSSNIDLVGNKYHNNLKSSLAVTLNEETGLSIRSMGQGATQPVLRGYSGDRFLLTENGITSGDLSNTSIDHTVSMDMTAYNKVRVIRGPEALLYGSNTIGGVIDVSRQIDPGARFKKASFQSLMGSESSNSSLFGNITCYIPLNYDHQFKFSYLNHEAKDEISSIGPIKNTALSNDEITANYSYFGKTFRTTFSYEQLEMDYGIPGSPEGHIDGVDIDLNKNTQKFNIHKDLSFMGFQTLDIDQRYIVYGHTEAEKGSSYPAVILEQDVFSLQSILKGPKVNIGSLFQYRKFRAGGFYWTPDTEELNFAVFGLFETKLNELIIQISSRAEYLTVIPNIYHRLSNIDTADVVKRDFPILSAGMSVFRNWKQWELSFGTMFTGRTPGIEDLYSDGPHLGTYAYEIGKPDLTLENILGFEIGLKYIDNKSKFRATTYQNYSPNYHISSKLGECDEEFIDGESHPCAGADFIEWGSGSSGWLYKYEMKGLKSYIYGFESDFEYQVSELINFFGSVSITRGENLSQKTPLAYMPPDKFLFSTELNLEPLSYSLTLKRVLEQNRLSEFETLTDGYFITSSSITYQINSSNFLHKIIFQVENIFNQEYYNHLSRIKSIMPEKGRSLNIQYRLLF